MNTINFMGKSNISKGLKSISDTEYIRFSSILDNGEQQIAKNSSKIAEASSHPYLSPFTPIQMPKEIDRDVLLNQEYANALGKNINFTI